MLRFFCNSIFDAVPLWKDAIQFLRRSWFSCSITGDSQKIPWQQTSGLEKDESEKKEVWYKKIEGI